VTRWLRAHAIKRLRAEYVGPCCCGRPLAGPCERHSLLARLANLHSTVQRAAESGCTSQRIRRYLLTARCTELWAQIGRASYYSSCANWKQLKACSSEQTGRNSSKTDLETHVDMVPAQLQQSGTRFWVSLCVCMHWWSAGPTCPCPPCAYTTKLAAAVAAT
jgi:hypothetical protein